MTASRNALRFGAAMLLAQLVLQLIWHGWLAPGSRATLAVAVLPLLPGIWIGLHNLRRGVLVGGIVSLFYFCHGVADWWDGNAALRGLASIEVLLSLALIGALYWDARGYTRPGPGRGSTD
jgi:uncharacterized membrane protein